MPLRPSDEHRQHPNRGLGDHWDRESMTNSVTSFAETFWNIFVINGQITSSISSQFIRWANILFVIAVSFHNINASGLVICRSTRVQCAGREQYVTPMSFDLRVIH
jgi:hypothetical protein